MLWFEVDTNFGRASGVVDELGHCLVSKTNASLIIVVIEAFEQKSQRFLISNN